MRKTVLFCLKRTVPILLGFFPVGIAYGILMQTEGYNALWTGASSLIVLTGSLQFLMVDFLKTETPLITVAVLALLLSSRHIFYGISFIERFRGYHPASKRFLIYSLADESYSLHCAYKPEEGVREEAAFVITAVLVVFYWTMFTVLGALIGSLITINTEGIDFSMTALFVVILIDQIRGAKSRLPLYAAIVSSLLCLLIFGADSFILPSLIMTVAALCVLRGKVEPEETEIDGEARS